MRENRTSGLTSGDGKRSGLSVVTAPVLDSTALMIMRRAGCARSNESRHRSRSTATVWTTSLRLRLVMEVGADDIDGYNVGRLLHDVQR